jgi:ParB family chromosome partitioning protein
VDLFFPEARKTERAAAPATDATDSEAAAAVDRPKSSAVGKAEGSSPNNRSANTTSGATPANVADKEADSDSSGKPQSSGAAEGQADVDADTREVASGSGSTSESRNDVELVEVPGVRFAEIPVTDIHPNRKQPRTVFDEDDMAELVHSVREIGVLQPIVVRTSTEKGGEPYELVMGERRWRAVQAAGLATIPAIVRDTTDDDLLRDALLENLHRSQLNPLEEAAAYQQLLEDFGTTHEQLADRIGRSRPQVSNTLRLLKLPPLVQRRVAANVLSAGHARALLSLPDAAAMERLAQRIVAEGMSVRATEEAVTLHRDPATPAKNNIPRPGARHERLDYLASSLSDRLDTNVKISLGARKGRVSIEFASVEDLNRIMDVLAPGSES